MKDFFVVFENNISLILIVLSLLSVLSVILTFLKNPVKSNDLRRARTAASFYTLTDTSQRENPQTKLRTEIDMEQLVSQEDRNRLFSEQVMMLPKRDASRVLPQKALRDFSFYLDAVGEESLTSKAVEMLVQKYSETHKLDRSNFETVQSALSFAVSSVSDDARIRRNVLILHNNSFEAEVGRFILNIAKSKSSREEKIQALLQLLLLAESQHRA